MKALPFHLGLEILSLIPAWAGRIWVQASLPTGAVEEPRPLQDTALEVPRDSLKVSDQPADGSVSWKPQLSGLAFQIRPHFVGTILPLQVFAFQMKCGCNPRGVSAVTGANPHLGL